MTVKRTRLVLLDCIQGYAGRATSNTVLCVSLSFLTHPRVLAIKLHWKMNLWNRAFLWRGMTKIPPHLTVDFDLLWDLRVDPSLSSVLCHYILAKEYHKTTFEFKLGKLLMNYVSPFYDTAYDVTMYAGSYVQKNNSTRTYGTRSCLIGVR